MTSRAYCSGQGRGCIVSIAARATALGRMLGLVIATALVGYLLVTYGRRHLFPRKLRTARVSPEALKR